MSKLSQLAADLEFGRFGAASPKVREKLERRFETFARDAERHANRRAKRFLRQAAED